jgi:homoserine O-succinyltransferase
MALRLESYQEGTASRIDDTPHPDAPAVRIGLINNMPDSALAATEAQFQELLAAAASDLPLRLRLSFLPEIERSAAINERLRSAYWPLEALLARGLDALIVTGAEPAAPSVRGERYWRRFTDLVDWAAAHTHASVWSCLAAHAAVEHLSGIARRRLPQKCCGLFEHAVLAGHPLMQGITAPHATPQSRWNDLPVEALRAAGYELLSVSELTGANLFARRVQRSLMLFVQGHPEYQAETLLREYRRDVERYARGQQPHYPTVPAHYFRAEALALLEAHRAKLQSDPQNRCEFPYDALAPSVQNSWQPAAVRLYANWFDAIRAARGRTTRIASA